MRRLRRPNMKEIIEANRQQGEDALRFSQDILFIPTLYPPWIGWNVTLGNQYLATTQTSYQNALQFQVLDAMKGCLNIHLWLGANGGGTAHFNWEDAALNSLWTDSTTSTSQNFGKSIPDFESDGTLRLQIKRTGGGTSARVRVNRIFLSARPFYSY